MEQRKKILLDLTALNKGVTRSLKISSEIQKEFESKLSLLSLMGLDIKYGIVPDNSQILEISLLISCTAIQVDVEDLSDHATPINRTFKFKLYPSDTPCTTSSPNHQWDIYTGSDFDVYDILLEEIKEALPSSPGAGSSDKMTA